VADVPLYECRRYGRAWALDPRCVTECPVCGAPPGSPCRRPSGHSGPMVESHAGREQLAVDRGLLERCPGPADGPPPERPVQPRLPRFGG
jgi:hypothetical protein